MLGGFTVLLLGEVGERKSIIVTHRDIQHLRPDQALIPILLVLNANIGPGQVSIICLFFFISIGVTVLATALITYRVIDVSRSSTGQTSSRYQYIVEILVESGVMYSSTLLIAGVLLAVRGNIDGPNYSITQAASYWGGILTPVTVSLFILFCKVIRAGSDHILPGNRTDAYRVTHLKWHGAR